MDNKTVVDAVNHYLGEIYHGHSANPSWARYIAFRAFSNKDDEFYLLSNKSKYAMCTVEEFNQCVAEMSDGTLWKSEAVIDYTSEEFWADAPEGATHWDDSAGVFCKKEGYWYKDTKREMVYSEDDDQFMWGDIDRYKPRPKKAEPTPIYTKSMEDNGILPSVGMECLMKMVGHYVPVIIKYNSEHVIVFTYTNDNGPIEVCKEKITHNIDIKPIDTRTTEQKAVDNLTSSLEDLLGGKVDAATLAKAIFFDSIVAGKITGVSFNE